MARGKGSERKQRHCGYNRPHQPHVYSGEKERDQGKAGARKYWCPGRAEATAEAAHKHIWEHGLPIRAEGELPGPDAKLFNGPFECPCGKSVWLKDGVLESAQRFPHADALERIMALKAKLDSGGPDALDEADKAELEAIAADIIRILQPLMEQLQKMADMIIQMIQSFLDSLSPETVAYLAELGKSIGEKPDHVDTIELRGSDGHLIGMEVLTPSPISAVPATALLSDEDQVTAIEYVSEPTTGPVPITTDLPSNVVHLQPGQALVGGRVIDLASLPVPRAQSFRSSSEY